METLTDIFDLLIEVGSMYGRYLKWAVENGKYYLGIDIVRRYIETGRKIISDLQLDQNKYKFMLGGAESIIDLVKPKKWNVKPKECLLFFPFNSFGNMEDPLVILKSIKKSGLPFLITTYNTDQETNACREQYYRNCGYSEIVSVQNEKGVRFISPEGLSTIAYHPDYLQKLSTISSLKVTSVRFSQIGVAFTLPKLAKRIIPITF